MEFVCRRNHNIICALFQQYTNPYITEKAVLPKDIIVIVVAVSIVIIFIIIVIVNITAKSL